MLGMEWRVMESGGVKRVKIWNNEGEGKRFPMAPVGQWLTMLSRV